jgi:hypothetical protein
MYIDPVSGTLQSLNDTAGNLNRIKAQYEEDQLKRAELLNRMGQNPAAERALWDANHSGLLTRYLPNRSEGWTVDSPFYMEGEQLDSLNSLSADAIEGQNLAGLDDKGLKAQALSALSGDFADARKMGNWGNVSDNSDAINRLRSLDGNMIQDDFVANKVFSSGGDEIAPQMVGDPVLKPLPFKTKGMADSNPYTQAYREKIKTYQKEKAANDLIETSNREKTARNSKIPSFARVYEGDETDQITQLNNDAKKAIKYYLDRGDTTSAMLAYDTYVTTGNSIAQRYQHDFKAIDAKSLFPKDKGGGGGTGKGDMVDYSYGTGGIDGKGTLIQLPKSVLGNEEAQWKYIQDNYKTLWDKEPNGRLSAKVGTEGTDYQTPEDRARTEDIENKNSISQNAAWEDLVEKYDGPFTSRAAAREMALAELKSQGKDVVMDKYGRYVIIETGGNNRNVVRSTGGGNAVDRAIGD